MPVTPLRRTRVRPAAVIDAQDAVLTVMSSGVCVEGGTSETREIIEVREFATNPAYVKVQAGVTKSLGDYEFLRVDVSISVPCYVEEIDSVYPAVAEKVSDRLTQEVEAYLGDGSDGN
jgi:hypothetical protein